MRGPYRSARRPKIGERKPVVMLARVTAKVMELRLQPVSSSMWGSMAPAKVWDRTAAQKAMVIDTPRTFQP
jgi:hypothetical protein